MSLEKRDVADRQRVGDLVNKHDDGREVRVGGTARNTGTPANLKSVQTRGRARAIEVRRWFDVSENFFVSSSTVPSTLPGTLFYHPHRGMNY